MVDTRISEAKRLMLSFADSTGLDGNTPPRRYLWTDAHAVCNFLSLYDSDNDARWLALARSLVDQVHQVLGRHRPDDERSGWISGLSDADGQMHPTIGGLRIGKQQPERGPDSLPDERGEWEQDGQYYHYLTKWMHALERMTMVTGADSYLRWAIELACTAHGSFRARSGPARLYWKMSIDLSYPLVPSSGHHDPLDGLVTALILRERATARDTATATEALDPVIEDLATQCRGRSWATDDPLGIGGLLFDASRVSQLRTENSRAAGLQLLEAILTGAHQGLRSFQASGALNLPANHRLAFRELGLSIGLQGIEPMSARQLPASIVLKLDALRTFEPLRSRIERLWLQPALRRTETWMDHDDINNVMLATSLVPDGFLLV